MACGLANRNFKPFYDQNAPSPLAIYEKAGSTEIVLPPALAFTADCVPSLTSAEEEACRENPRADMFLPLSASDQEQLSSSSTAGTAARADGHCGEEGMYAFLTRMAALRYLR